MHVRLSHPVSSQLQRTFERYFIAFGVQSNCDTITSECSLCTALARFPKQLDTFNPSPGPLHPGTHMNIDIMQRAGQSIIINCDRFSNFVTACIAHSQTRAAMIDGILATVTPIRHGSNVQVRTDKAKAFSSLATNPDPQLAENGITIILGDDANPNKNAAVDKMMQELESEIRRLSPDGNKLSAGTLSQAVNNLNNRTRGHGLTASQVHFSRDMEAGVNLRINDQKLWDIREGRKEALRKASQASPPPQVQPGQTVFLRGDGTKHKARDPFLVTKVEPEKVTMQKMAHVDRPSTALPRITSYIKKVDPKFLYIPPHKRFRKPLAAERVQRGAGGPQPYEPPPQHPLPPPPPQNSPGTSKAKPTRADLEVEEYWVPRIEDEGNEPAEARQQEGQLRLRPLVQMIAEDNFDPGGGQGEDEAAGPVVHERLPAFIQGPRQRRRPPRERWIVEQVPQPPPHQPAEPQMDQQLHAEDGRHRTDSGRLTRRPQYYGVEEEREETIIDSNLSTSTASISREEMPGSSTPALSCSSSPPGSVENTPIPTPTTSPDTSALTFPQDLTWLLTPMPCSLTAEQRASNPEQRHRHWSFTAPGVFPCHPRFLNWFGPQEEWDPGPRRWSSGGR